MAREFEIIVLETYIKIHTLQSMYGVMHELANKTEWYDEYLHNIRHYLVIGIDISHFNMLPLFIWESCKGSKWEDVYSELGEDSALYKKWIRRRKIKKVLDEE